MDSKVKPPYYQGVFTHGFPVMAIALTVTAKG